MTPKTYLNKQKRKILKNAVSSKRFVNTKVPAESAMLADAKLNIQTGRMFQTFRNSVRVSRADLARRSGYSASYIYSLERGKCRWNDRLVNTFIAALESTTQSKA